MIREGERAPDFAGSTAEGTQVRLADYRGKQPLVVFFYPKDNTTVCTREACGFRAVWDISGIVLRLLARGQTNFVRMLWKFGSVYNTKRLCADHVRPVPYELSLPPAAPAVPAARPSPAALYVHHPAAVAAGS